MEVTRDEPDTTVGPDDWFTGAVYIDAVAAPIPGTRLTASRVHFTPGARTAWHTHLNGQTIYVLEGVGLGQRRGGPVEVIRPGDRVFFEPSEDHWHGATATRFMAHLAMLETDDEGTSATRGDHVTPEEYGAGRRTAGEAGRPARSGRCELERGHPAQVDARDPPHRHEDDEHGVARAAPRHGAGRPHVDGELRDFRDGATTHSPSRS